MKKTTIIIVITTILLCLGFMFNALTARAEKRVVAWDSVTGEYFKLSQIVLDDTTKDITFTGDLLLAADSTYSIFSATAAALMIYSDGLDLGTNILTDTHLGYFIGWESAGDNSKMDADDMVDGSTNAAITLTQETAYDAVVTADPSDYDEIGDLPASVTLDAEWNTEAEVEAIWAATEIYTSDDDYTNWVVDYMAVSTFTRDAEWDTESEFEAACETKNFIVSTEIDTEAEFEAICATLDFYTSDDNYTDWVQSYMMADDSVDSAEYVDGSIDLVHLAAGVYAKDIVTTSPITGGTDNVLVGADSDVTIAMPAATNAAAGHATAAHITALEANTTHRSSDGTDHTYIDQDLRTSADVTHNKITATTWIYSSDQVYGVEWNGELSVPTKNAVYDKVEVVNTAVGLNTAKETNVSTSLSVGTVGVNTVAITSDGGADDVTLPAATVSTAGMLTTAKWAEIVANTAKVTNTDDQTIDVFSISGDNVQLSLEDDGEATKTVDISTTTAVTANTAKVTESTTATSPLVKTTYDISIPAATNASAGHATAAHITALEANTAKVTESTTVTSPLSLSTYNITIAQAGAAADGYLSSVNWNTFNNKQAAITGTDTHVMFFDGANTPAGEAGMTYNKTTDTLTTTTFSGALSGNSTTTTTASAGDAAVDFFGAGVTAVTDATTCTDIEGTKLSITTGTLNVTETDSVVGAVSGIVKADGGGNISVAVADTDYLVTLAKDLVTTSPITGGTDNILPGADADITIAINDAAADGSTKGAATFDANDFDAASGVISIDNVNFTIEDVLASVAAGDMIYRNDSGVWGIISKGADNDVFTMDGNYPNWEAGGAGGGDNVSIDSVAVVDPDFVSTGDIDFVDTSNTVTANVQADKITEAMLKCVNAAVDEYILTKEDTTGDYEWHHPSELITAGTNLSWTGTTLNVAGGSGDMSYSDTRSKILTATRDMTAASGDVSYTGTGFTPTAVHAVAVVNGTEAVSWGFADGVSGGAGSYQQYNGLTGPGSLLDLLPASGKTQAATLRSLDANGVTLTWLKTSTPTGTAFIKIRCLR